MFKTINIHNLDIFDGDANFGGGYPIGTYNSDGSYTITGFSVPLSSNYDLPLIIIGGFLSEVDSVTIDNIGLTGSQSYFKNTNFSNSNNLINLIGLKPKYISNSIIITPQNYNSIHYYINGTYNLTFYLKDSSVLHAIKHVNR